jgi:hypothetical protein
MKLESLMIKNAQNRESLREDEDCSSQRWTVSDLFFHDPYLFVIWN